MKAEKFVNKALVFSLVLSAFILAFYILSGVLPETGFTDQSLFVLLGILRYLSFLICVLSLCALGFSIRLIIRRPALKPALKIALYILAGIAGAGVAVLNMFIVAASGGNG